MNTKLNVTYGDIASQSVNLDDVGYGRVKMQEPRAYKGAQDVKELENFTFDMKQHIRAVRTNLKDVKHCHYVFDW